MDLNVKTFNVKSSEYSDFRPKYPKELYKFILATTKKHDRVWDSACGNGQVAIDISKYFTTVEASDIHKNQIENAFKTDNINYSVQDSVSTNFPDNFFDVICVAQAFHWFNPEDFFNEVKRVLKRKGLFFCWGYSFFNIDFELDNIIKTELFDKIDAFWSEKNKILHNEYKTINFPFRKIKTPSFKMQEEWTLEQLLNYINTWSAVKLFNEKHNSDITSELKNSLIRFWKTTDKKTVTMIFFVYGGVNN